LPIENRLSLTGEVVSLVKQKQSPLGIPNYRFWLEHRSTQTEVNLERQAWCKIQVVLNGNQFYKMDCQLSGNRVAKLSLSKK